jgi:hypothetical protein
MTRTAVEQSTASPVSSFDMAPQVVDLLGATFGRAAVAAILQARHEAQAAVHQAVAEGWPNACVRGSWYHGDFHLGDGESHSDLDLYEPSLSLQQEAKLVVDGIGKPLRVSRQPDDYRALLTMDEARLFASLLLLAEPCDIGYVRAKVALLILRERPSERYGDVARRMGTRGARLALATKLGALTAPLDDEVLKATRNVLVLYPWGIAAWAALTDRADDLDKRRLIQAASRAQSVPARFAAHLVRRAAGDLGVPQ